MVAREHLKNRSITNECNRQTGLSGGGGEGKKLLKKLGPERRSINKLKFFQVSQFGS